MSLSVDGSRTSAQVILDALIALNQAEGEAARMKRLSARIKAAMETQRVKIPASILTHHDRLKARGRRSAVAVHHDVCSGCHIAVAHSMRALLRHKMDLNVCDNCGCYIYLEEVLHPAPAAAAPTSAVPTPAAPRPVPRVLAGAVARTRAGARRFANQKPRRRLVPA